MNLPTLSSPTTTSNTMESPFTTPCTLPPTIIKPEGGPKDDCTSGGYYVSVPVWAFILFIALFVKIFIGRIRVTFDLEKSRAEVARLISGQALESSVANVKEATTATKRLGISEDHEVRKQVWNETYQQDASRMMKIRALAEDAKDTLVLRRSWIHNKEKPPSEQGYVYEEGYSRAAHFIDLLLQTEFEGKYGILSFQLKTDAEGKYTPGPLFGHDFRLRRSERLSKQGDEV